jgi:uroporphyrinogen decarboxylase
MVGSNRERFLAVLKHRIPDRVPVTDLDIDGSIVEKITGVKTSGGGQQSPTIDRKTGWQKVLRNIDALIDAHRALDFDAFLLTNYRMSRKGYKPKFLDKETFIDEWGRRMKIRKDTGIVWYCGGTINTEEELEAFNPPNVHEPGREEVLLHAIKSAGKEMAVGGEVQTGFVISWEARGGLDKLVIDMYRNPTFAKKVMKKFADACFEFAKMMLDDGVDLLVLTDDYADNHGPIISPALFREFELPYLKRVIETANNRNVPVMKHSDGNLYPLLNDLIDVGISGLHPIEPGPMDIADVKKRYGDRIFLGGNVDCKRILPYGSESDVRKDVRRVIDAAGKDGGLVLTSSNSLHSGVKVDNIFTMVDEARKYGKYMT